MKFLHTADLHFGASRKVPDHLNRQRTALRYMFDTAVNERCDFMLIAGDIFERSDITPVERDAFVEELVAFDDEGIKVFMIPGNHDILYRGEYNQLRLLGSLEQNGKLGNVTVFDKKPGWYVDSDVVIVGVPFKHNPKDPSYPKYTIRKLVESGDAKDMPVVVMVHGVHSDAHTDDGYTYKSSDTTMILYNKYVTYWALGDIHTQQQIAPNSWYCGAPIQHKFNDDISTRGFLLVDIEGEDLVNVESRHVEGVKPLVMVHSEDDLEAIEDAWVKTVGCDISDPRVVDHQPVFKDEDVDIEAKDDLLEGLRDILINNGLNDDEADEALTLAEGLRGRLS